MAIWSEQSGRWLGGRRVVKVVRGREEELVGGLGERSVFRVVGGKKGC